MLCLLPLLTLIVWMLATWTLSVVWARLLERFGPKGTIEPTMNREPVSAWSRRRAREYLQR